VSYEPLSARSAPLGAATRQARAGLGFVRVSPMPRSELDQDFSYPVMFGRRRLFQYRTRIGFGLQHGNCRSDWSVPTF
jgi:hypothetical protein